MVLALPVCPLRLLKLTLHEWAAQEEIIDKEAKKMAAEARYVTIDGMEPNNSTDVDAEITA